MLADPAGSGPLSPSQWLTFNTDDHQYYGGGMTDDGNSIDMLRWDDDALCTMIAHADTFAFPPLCSICHRVAPAARLRVPSATLIGFTHLAPTSTHSLTAIDVALISLSLYSHTELTHTHSLHDGRPRRLGFRLFQNVFRHASTAREGATIIDSGNTFNCISIIHVLIP